MGAAPAPAVVVAAACGAVATVAEILALAAASNH